MSQPPAMLYRLNQEHLTYPYVMAMTGLRAELIGRIKDAITTWRVPARHASLFGSFARGEAGASSDIDILTVPHPGHDGATGELWQTQIADLAEHITQWTGNPSQILDLDEATLAHMLTDDAPTIQSWRADQSRLAGTDLMAMLREIRHQVELPAAGPR